MEASMRICLRCFQCHEKTSVTRTWEGAAADTTPAIKVADLDDEICRCRSCGAEFTVDVVVSAFPGPHPSGLSLSDSPDDEARMDGDMGEP